MPESIVFNPKFHCTNAFFLRSFKRSASRAVLCGNFWENEDGGFCVRQIKLEFRNGVCRVERGGDCSGHQKVILACLFTNTWFRVGIGRQYAHLAVPVAKNATTNSSELTRLRPTTSPVLTPYCFLRISLKCSVDERRSP